MIETITLPVTGMKCGGCETNVVNKLNTIAGIKSVQASSKDNKVEVAFEKEKTDLDAIKAAITAAGYFPE
jgi:copper chaperone